MNILYLMFDQLRFDYLSCAGHPTLHTPHIDSIAAKGVRFTNAYTQSPICGPSRMSAYTGRYPSSHGAQWNGYPLRVGEATLGDHLREAGMGCWLVGKTHMKADVQGMARLGIAPDSVVGKRQAECGFDVWCRDDGLWAVGPDGPYDSKPSPYNDHLASKGYAGANPWADFANAGREGDDIASGWFMRNAGKPAAVAEQDSETPWLTGEAIRFMEATEGPWCAHVSYIKPHWPYIAPAPYNDMYSVADILPPVRSESELQDAHPVYRAFTEGLVGRNFSRDEVREAVIPAYMGLIKQCDDQIGRLLRYLKDSGRDQDTMIVLTSDHGDYLGDHWMGEKDLFHAPSVKVPLIVYDPRASADATRGSTCDALVELIDVTATLIEAAGGEVPDHIVEGRSLMPYVEGRAHPNPRDYAISEYDYACHPVGTALDVPPRDARMVMVATRDWKLVHCEGGLPPMLFDLKNDPDELRDLGRSADHAGVRAEMYGHLHHWARRMSQRLTVSDAQIMARRSGGSSGVLLGVFDEADVPLEESAAYRGKAPE
ncbi:sulfatase-like hydrolase/transferase [Pseudoruegeria sp. SHC-113]|uniref:sulfatase-like hydrolase/transferase n=1 Tax=Pseudoruegeria sp. SHC-113 TaxID=2855439 RepID=UPI0021BB4F9C|nr:sulfatase-like hydrolase/transferase [Pseudoruegeria sp. SHC-113]MCT8162090.1 sulfatase-like hydrolase/transferase [Pseudoruegeria sp. SHC-113]